MQLKTRGENVSISGLPEKIPVTEICLYCNRLILKSQTHMEWLMQRAHLVISYSRLLRAVSSWALNDPKDGDSNISPLALSLGTSEKSLALSPLDSSCIKRIRYYRKDISMRVEDTGTSVQSSRGVSIHSEQGLSNLALACLEQGLGQMHQRSCPSNLF